MSAIVERVAKAILDTMDITDGLDGIAAENYALAAIEAMREPTDEMVDAGDMWADGPGYSAKVWKAMIDKALGKVDA